MGSCWTGTSEQKFLNCERRVLQHSGLDYDTEMSITNIVIDWTGTTIRTLEIGDHTKPVMVLMHGYGGSFVIFWKLMKPLSEKYHLILVDILGMGGSSRPEFNVNTQEESDYYMTEWIEAWRIKVRPKILGGLTDFILAGHSFGGYLCGLYAIKYH